MTKSKLVDSVTESPVNNTRPKNEEENEIIVFKTL